MKPKLRFSLRMLFVLMTGVALVFGVALGPAIRHREQKRSAVTLIATLGGKYKRFGSSIAEQYRESWLARQLGWEEFPAELWDVDLSGTKVSGKDLAQLGGCNWIRTLDLSNTGIGDADVAQLQRLDNLLSLSLTNTKVTDVALTHLAAMQCLYQLKVGGTAITYDGLAALDRRMGVSRFEEGFALEHRPFAGVEVFAPESFGKSIGGEVGTPPLVSATQAITIRDAAKIVPAELEHLAHLKNVRSILVTSDTKASFGSFDILAGFPELRSAEVYGGSISDADLNVIARLPKLHNLAIYDWRLPSEALEVFGDNYSLKRLDLNLGKDQSLDVTKHLRGFKALESLGLSCWQRSTVDRNQPYGPPGPEQLQAAIAAIGRLRELPNLKTLRLSGNLMTDEVFLSLADFPHLTTVLYAPDAIRASTVEALIKALPGCEVTTVERIVNLNDD